MNDLQVLIARIEKLLAEREAEGIGEQNSTGQSIKGKWREVGFTSGLEWAAQEARNILADSEKRSE